MPITRYFSPDSFIRIQRDFKFLFYFIDSSYGEYDFAIRENYFNIYYMGNSLAMVKPIRNNLYRVSISNDFFRNTKANDPKRFPNIKPKKDCFEIVLSRKELHPFFQANNIREIASEIKKRNYGEEINFEQSLITDNLNRKKIIVIDRQVTDTILKRKRMDLLFLRNLADNKYQFVVAEVKLGFNKELKGKVVSQLDHYVQHIKLNFDYYKPCYELHYEQKKKLDLIKHPAFPVIEIVPPVEGIIVVGGYSGKAKEYINILKTTGNTFPV